MDKFNKTDMKPQSNTENGTLCNHTCTTGYRDYIMGAMMANEYLTSVKLHALS